MTSHSGSKSSSGIVLLPGRARAAGRLGSGTFGRRAWILWHQLVDRNIPSDMTDRDLGRLLALIELDHPARAVIAQSRHHHLVAHLNQCPRVGKVDSSLSFGMQLGQPLLQRFARALGVGLCGQRR